MDAKKYVVYRPDESDLTCRVYVRCDCSRFNRKHEWDSEEEDSEDKRCDKKKPCHDYWEEKDKFQDRYEEKKPWKEEEEEEEEENKWRDRCEEKPEKHEEEEEYRGRHARRSKKSWYKPYDGEEEKNKEQPERQHPGKYDERHKDCDDRCWKPECPEKEQTHVHEFLGSTKLAEECEDRHNHRFAGVSSEEIPIPGGHIHRILTHTDFFDHFHDICKLTGPAIEVEDEEIHCKGYPIENRKWHKEKKHVHFVKGWTTFVDGHMHEFQVATLIESPLLPQPKHDR